MIGKTISHYRILSQIGEGGMGVVYVAEDLLLGRRVAIKIPHAGRDERHYRARFLREARAASNLTHRNIAAVYDLGEMDDGQPYIVMELVSGQTLGDILTGTGLSIARSVEVVREVAEALSEAHRRNVVHRDVKPSNVIINERGEVKVLDFGLAKQLDEEFAHASAPEAQTLLSARTRSDVVIGTPLYLSPEQARGARVDGRSDLFALGALLYECVAGRPAFSGSNVIEIGAQVLHFDPPPPSRYNPRVPAELDRVVAKALAKKPEDRYQTAEEFAAELARVRSRLNNADTMLTSRLATAEHLARPSGLITMAEGLRRPRFSPLAVIGVLAALLGTIWAVAYVRRPSTHKPSPAALKLYEGGVEALREGAYYKASEMFKQSLEEDDRFALAHARLAEAWMELDFLDRAKDEVIIARELVPDRGVLAREDALYLDAVSSAAKREYGLAVKAYEEIAKLKPDRPQVYLDLGRAYEENNDTQKAINSYTEAVKRDASYAAASLRLGVMYARQKNLPGAVSAFDRAEKLYAEAGNKEGETEVHYQRGRHAVEQSKRAEARRELDQALSLARSTKNQYQQVQAMLQLCYVQDTPEGGRAMALDAIDIAQASGMSNQVANGYVTLGILFLTQRNADEAERHLTRALEYASNFKLHRMKAKALFTMGSLRITQNRPEEALPYAEQARDFYKQGGYRKEIAMAVMLIARIMWQQGDYDASLSALREQLRIAEQSGDMPLLGNLHREVGSVLAKQGNFPETLSHYEESLDIARALRDEGLTTYPLLNLANSFWRLGRYAEAAEKLALLAAMVGKPESPYTEMKARALLTEAGMALSRRRFDEAKTKAAESLALAQSLGGRPDITVEANSALCLADVYAGAAARGRPLCEEAARAAEATRDPWFVSNSQLALAEALLETGDAAGGLNAALRARDLSARSGRVESEWRSLVVAGRASRRAGDEAAAREHMARASALLSRLEQEWGSNAESYLSRPDVQRLRKEFPGTAVKKVQ